MKCILTAAKVLARADIISRGRTAIKCIYKQRLSTIIEGERRERRGMAQKTEEGKEDMHT